MPDLCAFVCILVERIDGYAEEVFVSDPPLIALALFRTLQKSAAHDQYLRVCRVFPDRESYGQIALKLATAHSACVTSSETEWNAER